MAFTDDGKVLASVGGGFVCIWNAESGKRIDKQRYSYAFSGALINSVQFDARGERLIFVHDRHLFMRTLGAEGHSPDPESLRDICGARASVRTVKPSPWEPPRVF